MYVRMTCLFVGQKSRSLVPQRVPGSRLLRAGSNSTPLRLLPALQNSTVARRYVNANLQTETETVFILSAYRFVRQVGILYLNTRKNILFLFIINVWIINTIIISLCLLSYTNVGLLYMSRVTLADMNVLLSWFMFTMTCAVRGYFRRMWYWNISTFFFWTRTSHCASQLSFKIYSDWKQSWKLSPWCDTSESV